MKKMTGLTFMIVFGKWAKPKMYLGKGDCYGVCLGLVSIQFVKYDMEVWVYNANKMMNDLQANEVKAFLAGYKNRAEGSNLIYDATSELYARGEFAKYKYERDAQ